jgi:hypothetical protein
VRWDSMVSMSGAGRVRDVALARLLVRGLVRRLCCRLGRRDWHSSLRGRRTTTGLETSVVVM